MTHREAIALLDNPLLRTPAPDAPRKAPTHWADLGAGSGVFTIALATFLAPGSTIDAIDRSPSIPKQTTKNDVHIHPITADFTDPNLQLAHLDGILLANALHYVKDQPQFIRQLHQSLKPGGSLILIEYNTDTPVPRWVPFPLSFNTASRLFTPPHWQSLKKSAERPSSFGRATIYCAHTTKENK